MSKKIIHDFSLLLFLSDTIKLNRYITVVIGKTTGFYHQFVQAKLHNLLPNLQEVETVDECDFILVFCTGHGSETAYKMLAYQPGTMYLKYYRMLTASRYT